MNVYFAVQINTIKILFETTNRIGGILGLLHAQGGRREDFVSISLEGRANVAQMASNKVGKMESEKQHS